MKTSDIEQDILARIEELLTNLNSTRTTFQAWSESRDPALATEHQAWQIRKRKAFLRDAAQVAEFESQDPYLQSLASVKELKAKIAKIQLELSVAKNELNRLYDRGTPRDQYRNLIETGQNAVVQLKQHLKQSRLDTILQETYHTSDASRLPDSCIDAAKLHPAIIAIDMVNFVPLLNSVQGSDLALENGYNRIADVLSKLRALMVVGSLHGPV